ncbi:flagellar basal body rod protein FlgC [Bacillus andreraoultii]|uniref:flagellar basal body rod protein FlgC n=1 Tax=Bacillus andreraoultii TaxID=1499685 RepID=UPI0009464EB2
MFSNLNISASALTAQRLRMDVISSNVANADSTRGKFIDGQWVPYRRKSVVLEPKGEQFSSILNQSINKASVGSGVKVTKITEDQSPFQLVYNPEHPDANEDGYVQMPNVDPLREMVDLISATRSYEANVTVFNASKSMLTKALEIGK